jgi:hypothetical protein
MNVCGQLIAECLVCLNYALYVRNSILGISELIYAARMLGKLIAARLFEFLLKSYTCDWLTANTVESGAL